VAHRAKHHIVKLSVNLASAVIDALRELARKRGVTMTEVIRDAIGNEKFFDNAVRAGSKILIEDKHGRVRWLRFD